MLPPPPSPVLAPGPPVGLIQGIIQTMDATTILLPTPAIVSPTIIQIHITTMPPNLDFDTCGNGTTGNGVCSNGLCCSML